MVSLYSHMYLFTKETAPNFRLFLILHLGTSIFLQLVTNHTVTHLLTAKKTSSIYVVRL